MRKIASCSGGKDSVAMTDRLIREGMIDEVVYYNNGMDFKAITNVMNKIKTLCEENGVKYTELKPKNDFLYQMFEKPVKSKDGTTHLGYSWCGGICRWGTTEKIKALEKYCEGAIEFIGIALDEPGRILKKRKGLKRFPLAEWGMTEDDCLKYCREKGYQWLEGNIDLYDILDRVSCWCCANKNLKELKNYFLYLPEYWKKLKELQAKTNRPFKYGKYTINQLEEKFKKEKKTNE